MSKFHTTYIVGAGASDEFGFPVGKGLQEEICELIRPNRDYELGFHNVIAHVIDLLISKGVPYSKLMEHLSWMSDAIRLYPSIDNFLDRNSEPGDPTSIIGKLAIASIIGLREASSILANETQSIDWKSLSNPS